MKQIVTVTSLKYDSPEAAAIVWHKCIKASKSLSINDNYAWQGSHKERHSHLNKKQKIKTEVYWSLYMLICYIYIRHIFKYVNILYIM